MLFFVYMLLTVEKIYTILGADARSKQMIIETSDNCLYFVVNFADASLAHVWDGLRVKRVKDGFVVVKNPKKELVRKAGSREIAPFSALKGAA